MWWQKKEKTKGSHFRCSASPSAPTRRCRRPPLLAPSGPAPTGQSLYQDPGARGGPPLPGSLASADLSQVMRPQRFFTLRFPPRVPQRGLSPIRSLRCFALRHKFPVQIHVAVFKPFAAYLFNLLRHPQHLLRPTSQRETIQGSKFPHQVVSVPKFPLYGKSRARATPKASAFFPSGC